MYIVKIDISKIVGHDGESLNFEGEIRYDDIENPVAVKGKISNMAEQYLIDIDISVIYNTECARCLAPVREVVSCPVSEIINSEDNKEFFKLSRNFVDITEAVYTNLIPNLSRKFLCRDDCKGLCFVCGTNLNEKGCGCNRESSDSRFDVLKNMFNKDE